MPFTRDKISLFWSMPPTAKDWENLHTAGVKRMQLVLPFADDETLLRLQEAGVSGITLRVSNTDLGRNETRVSAALRIRHAVALQAGVDTVILGNEPENGIDLTYKSASWGQGIAWAYGEQLKEMLWALRVVPVKTIAPAFTMRSISEDEPPAPGLITWREILAPVYNKCNFAGVHLYQYNYLSEVDILRTKWALKRAQELCHKPLWIDECNVGSGDQVTRMRSFIGMAALLETHPLGGRAECLTLFVSNGTGSGYSPGLVINDPAAYRLLGAYQAGGA